MADSNIIITGTFVDKVSKGVQTMAGNISKGVSQANKAFGSVSVGQMVKGVTGGLITFELLKKALRGLVDTLKDFDKASGGTTLATMKTQFSQMSIEIGSVLMPYLAKFSKWWTDNESTILDVVRRIAKGTAEMGSVIAQSAKFGISMYVEKIAQLMGLWARMKKFVLMPNEVANNKMLLQNAFDDQQKYFRSASKLPYDEWRKQDFNAKTSDMVRKVIEDQRKIISGYDETISFAADLEKKMSDSAIDSAGSIMESADKIGQAITTMSDPSGVKVGDDSLANKRDEAKVKQLTMLLLDMDKALASFSNSAKSYVSDMALMAQADAFVAAEQDKYIANLKSIMDVEQERQMSMQDYVNGVVDSNTLVSYSFLKTTSDIEAAINAQVISAEDGAVALTKAYTGMTATIVDSISSANSTFFGALSDLWSYQQSVLDKQTAAQVKHAQGTIKDEKKLAAEIEKIEGQAMNKRIELRRKELLTQLAMAIANTAEGITKAIAQGGVLGIITGIAVGAAGAIQTAVIADQLSNMKAGYATGGIVPGSSFSGDKVPARVNSGEMILNQSQQAQLFAQANGKGNGGGDGITIHENIVVNGNLDRAAADQVRNDREKQLTRLRQDLKDLSWRGQLSFA